jgi:hypothetical protein
LPTTQEQRHEDHPNNAAFAAVAIAIAIALVGGILFFTSSDQGDAARALAPGGTTALTAKARERAARR